MPPLPDYVKNYEESQKVQPQQQGEQPTPAPVHPTPAALEAGPAPVPPPAVSTPEVIEPREVRPTESELREAAQAKAEPVVAALRARLEEQLKAAADATEAFVKDVAKAPAHDKRVLKERSTKAEAMMAQLTSASEALSASRDGLEKALVEAGLDRFDASRQAMDFGRDFDATQKAFACDRLKDLCERVKAESTVLDQNFAAWTMTKGEITLKNTKDAKLRHELTKERFFVEAGCKQSPELVKRLRGG
jgi:hypothetical protein